MFEPMFDNLRKATEASQQMQQELFKKWTTQWPVSPPTAPAFGENAQKLHKKWVETVEETLKKQHDVLEAQFKTGLQNLEAAFHLTEAKTVDELRNKTLELWQKTFECLKKTSEAQVKEFQAAVARWTETATKGAA